MHDSTFITEDDILYFKNNNIDYNVDMPIFLKEIRAYFNATWEKQYYIEKEVTIDELNSRYLENYPSTGGKHIIDDSFTGSCPTEMLSHKSKFILKTLYDIHLR
jgi:hypothetical protein